MLFAEFTVKPFITSKISAKRPVYKHCLYRFATDILISTQIMD
jgi:hypothetical protein